MIWFVVLNFFSCELLSGFTDDRQNVSLPLLLLETHTLLNRLGDGQLALDGDTRSRQLSSCVLLRFLDDS